MTTSVNDALLLTIAMAAAIFFCRLFPFLFFREKTGSRIEERKEDKRITRIAARGMDCGAKKMDCGANEQSAEGAADKVSAKTAFLNFVEKTVPPAAMTVLAFNALTIPAIENPGEIIPSLAAAAFTAIVHLWKRNPLISIFGGTAVFMLLQRVI